MPKFSANLSMLFGEHQFLDRFDAAARAGFTGVEYIAPYDHAPDVVSARLKKNGLAQVLFNLPPGDWASGERGIAVLPGRSQEFREGVDKAITYAKALGCPQVNCLAGIAPAGADRTALENLFVENLAYAVEKLEKSGIRLLIEPINTLDIPGFCRSPSRPRRWTSWNVSAPTTCSCSTTSITCSAWKADLGNTIKANLPSIKHIQLADNPGRFEPGTGEINYHYLFSLLEQLGYDGWIGCEYKPKAGTLRRMGLARYLGI